MNRRCTKSDLKMEQKMTYNKSGGNPEKNVKNVQKYLIKKFHCESKCR